MPGRSVDIVVFDLGGVLIELGGMQSFRELTGIVDDETMWERWLGSPWVRRFETGDCSAQEFSDGLVAEWGLPVSPDSFLEMFASWPIGPFRGTEAMLSEVQASVPIACCSNTNTLHWEFQSREWPFLDVFDYRFLSFEMALVKPDPDMFEAIASSLPVRTDRVLFLDDVLQNVEAARRIGFRSEQVRGGEECRAVLDRFGLLRG